MFKKALLGFVMSLFASLVMAQGRVSIDSLTLEQKAARMLIVGMVGTEIDDEVKRDIDMGVGGVILFERNIYPAGKKVDSKKRLAQLCRDLVDYAGRPFIVSVDQEGGKVNRLKSKYGFADMPSAEWLGRVNDPDTTRKYARLLAATVDSMGFNVNFAPCVDVNVNSSCPVIGKVQRSFSADADTVALHASIVMQEHAKLGVAASMKHFPGHGSSKVDSHNGFTDVSDTWSERELEPYRQMIYRGMCNMVMVGHLFNRNIDSIYPATLSKKTIGLLRDSLGFNGVVVTDDMHMGAITKNYSLERSLRLAINAGVDLIILSSNIPGSTNKVSDKAVKAICKAVRSGKISEHRLDESINRVEALLEWLYVMKGEGDVYRVDPECDILIGVTDPCEGL
ncbi:MAG: hypothetical protein K2N86_02335 [Rikenellaceae bacterium]|nr:hypothetical protein [Rikenellaceae bacterium]MDE7356735.1 hypothetical protein [Rikenellaceae bacterium]